MKKTVFVAIFATALLLVGCSREINEQTNVVNSTPISNTTAKGKTNSTGTTTVINENIETSASLSMDGGDPKTVLSPKR